MLVAHGVAARQRAVRWLPWGRLAFGQSEGWFLPLASIGGAPLLSFAVALSGAGLASVAVTVRARASGATN